MNDFLRQLRRQLRVLKREGLIVYVGIDHKWSDGVEYGGTGPTGRITWADVTPDKNAPDLPGGTLFDRS